MSEVISFPKAKLGLEQLKLRAGFAVKHARAFGLDAPKIYRDQKAGRTDLEYVIDRGLEQPFTLPTTAADIAVYREMRTGAVYKKAFQLLSPHEKAPALDIGANIGTISCLIASKLPHVQVHAVEPEDRNYKYLTTNANQYGGRIVTIQAALTSESGRATLANSARISVDDHASYRYEANPTETAGVAALSPQDLDAIVGQPSEYSIVAMDVEGAEKALCNEGVMDELLAKTGVWLVETHDRHVPGSDDAVLNAAARAGLELVMRDSFDLVFSC